MSTPDDCAALLDLDGHTTPGRPAKRGQLLLIETQIRLSTDSARTGVGRRLVVVNSVFMPSRY